MLSAVWQGRGASLRHPCLLQPSKLPRSLCNDGVMLLMPMWTQVEEMAAESSQLPRSGHSAAPLPASSPLGDAIILGEMGMSAAASLRVLRL